MSELQLPADPQSYGFIRINGLSTRYRRTGYGDPLILLHGWGSRLDALRILQDYLSEYFDTISLDLPGFGNTDFPKTDWALDDYVNFLLSFVEQLNIKRFDIIGHSFGGRLGIKLAARHPDHVRRLVLIDSAGVRQFATGTGIRPIISKLAKYAKPLLYLFPEPLRQKARWEIYRTIGSTDYLSAGRLKGTYANIINEDLEILLPMIQKQTMLLWGDTDKDTPLADGKLMASKIEGSQFHTLKAAGHYSFVDQPEETRMHLANFYDLPGQK
jgi:pimeloyl-ACP methyl ester carboxylesterase